MRMQRRLAEMVARIKIRTREKEGEERRWDGEEG